MNQYDYGARIYDPRIGKFLSVDPLSAEYPWYTPYQFAGNKPIRYIDIDGLEEGDALEKFWQNQPQIDMTKAPAKNYNKAGIPRNGLWMARQQFALKPEMFSEANKNRIFVQNKMPIADAQWIKFNPEASPYPNQSLIHHHVDGGKMAVLITEGQHRNYFSKLHAYLKQNVSGAKVKGMMGGTLSVLGTVSMFNTGNPDSWINGFSGGEQAEDYVGKIKKDFGSGIYVEINSVAFEHTPVFQNGKQVFNKDGSPKTYISQRTITGTLYSDYIYDEDAGEYRGINKIETRTEVWQYDQNGNRIIPKTDNKL